MFSGIPSALRHLCVASAIAGALVCPAIAETLYLSNIPGYSGQYALPGKIYTLDTDTGVAATYDAYLTGATRQWPAPPPMRLSQDGTIACGGSEIWVNCINTATRASLTHASSSRPYDWDITQDGRTLIASTLVYDYATLRNLWGIQVQALPAGTIIGSVTLESYAIAASPGSLTATVLAKDPTDTATIAQGRIPFNLVKIDLATAAVLSTVPLRDQAGAKVTGPWTLYGLADTGGDLVLWNGDPTASVLVFSATGVLQRQIAAPSVNVLTLSADGGTAYVANGTKAQRLNLAAGSVVADYTANQISSVALSADGKALYGAGLSALPWEATVTAWSTDSNQAVKSWSVDKDVRSIAAAPGLRRPPAPQTGWWWDPARSGAGYAIEVQEGGKTFVGHFIFEPDGRPVWFASSCVLDSRNTCTGRLDKFTGGMTLSGTYQAPTYVGSAGPMTLSFASANDATLIALDRWNHIVRFPIDQAAGITAPPSWAPQTGWWWAPNESGTGWFVESQGTVTQGGTTYSNMFAVGYLFGSDGQPVWYTSNALYGQVATAGGPLPSYQGTLAEYANGPPYTGGLGSGVTLTGQRGDVTLLFTGQTTATLTLPGGRSIPLIRYVLP